jgi:hypothetical protein
MRMCLYSCLSFPTHKAYAPYYIVISDMSGSTILLSIISKTARISGKSNGTQNVCFDFLYKFRLKYFSF